jgi:hypothetical protein
VVLVAKLLKRVQYRGEAGALSFDGIEHGDSMAAAAGVLSRNGRRFDSRGHGIDFLITNKRLSGTSPVRES